VRTVCGKIANIPVESNAVIRRAVCCCSVAGAAHVERWKGTNGEHRRCGNQKCGDKLDQRVVRAKRRLADP
jgi:hypothetical protein